MALAKTTSYLSSISEVPNEAEDFDAALEAKRAVKLLLKRDFGSALEIFNELKNEKMILFVKKCIELQDLFEQFLNADISLSSYRRASRKYPEEAIDIVQYKYPNLEFIELKNLERKFREKIEGIIDDLLSKNTLESLIEARKVYEKNIGVIKKPYNFDKLFLKTISFIPYKEFAPLYKIEWTNVEELINGYLLEQSNNFNKAETIINEIKVIDKNRETIRQIIKNFNRTFEIRLKMNYRESKLKFFVREYNKHSFYYLDSKSKVNKMTEPFFLQRRIYSIFYLNENCELFLDMLKANIDCMSVIPFENQKAYYHGIIRSIKKTLDYSIFEYFKEETIKGRNFTEVIQDSLEEDEVTIRRIVEYLKGKNNQEFMESLFLNIFKKELTFADTKKAPEFNKENSEVLINQYKENYSVIQKTKATKVFIKTLAAFELILSALLGLGIPATCGFAFRAERYFLGVAILLVGIVIGIWAFARLEEAITFNRERRLLRANRLIDELEAVNVVLLKKIYLGID